MLRNLLFLTFTVLIQYCAVHGQRQWISPTTSAAEMRNPYTWFWPYAIAASEGYRDFFVNAQQATNQLYQQAAATQAFPWASGGLGGQSGMFGPGGMGGQSGMFGPGGMGGQGGMFGPGGVGGQGGMSGPSGMGGTSGTGGQGGMGGNAMG